MDNEILSNNKKTHFDYDFYESYIAGIQLLGSEIKSIRLNKVSISDSFCKMQNFELYIINMHISKYKCTSIFKDYVSRRKRKLLLKKSELKKIECKIKKYGFTVIPNNLFLNKKGIAKLKISLVKGKKLLKKHDFIKKKENFK